jgi:hypothetical protein
MNAVAYSLNGANVLQPEKSPIQVTGQHGVTVTFIVHQVWKKDESMSWVATEYNDPTIGWNCPSMDTVLYGPLREFTASCDGSGWTNVKVYVQDDRLQGMSNEEVSIPDYCSQPQDSGSTFPFFYKVPCNPGCYPMSSDCINEAELESGVGLQTYNSNPIEIVSQDSANVTFRVLQTWVSQPLCFVATHYTSTTNGVACDLKEAVKPGSGGLYTAECQGGTSSVTLYIHDTSFNASTNRATIPDMCQPSANDRIVSYTFRIPCKEPGESCVPIPDFNCTDGIDRVVLFEDFESNQHRSWTFGAQARNPTSSSYIGPLDASRQEVFKVVPVPRTPTASLLQFSLLQFGNWTDSDKFYARIRSQYMDLRSFLGNLESRTGLFGDLKVSMSIQATPTETILSSASKRFLVSVRIPRRLYADGHLMIGFKATFSTGVQARTAGVDDLMLTAICDPNNLN